MSNALCSLYNSGGVAGFCCRCQPGEENGALQSILKTPAHEWDNDERRLSINWNDEREPPIFLALCPPFVKGGRLLGLPI